MVSEQLPGRITPDATDRPFTAIVTTHADGGWLSILKLGEGATLNKWFPDEEGARRYPDELAAWLSWRNGTR